MGPKCSQCRRRMDTRKRFAAATATACCCQILIICAIFGSMQVMDARRPQGKKKVLIIGEMSDLAYELATNATANVPYHEAAYEDYVEPNRVRKRTGFTHRTGPSAPPGSVFVPVAAYSVTHSRVPTTARGQFTRRMKPIRKQFASQPQYSIPTASASVPGKTTESAVYGYMNRPEIVEFRGQYFYGPNPVAAGSEYTSGKYLLPAASGFSTMAQQLTGNRGSGFGIGSKLGGLGPGGLLLATLPLILAPMLSYLFTPMIIPVTATIAAGKRRRRRGVNGAKGKAPGVGAKSSNKRSSSNDLPTLLGISSEDEMKSNNSDDESDEESSWTFDRLDPKLKEIRVVADYLRKVHFDEKDRDKAMANYLQCDGMLDMNDHCLERLSCEFSDPQNYNAPQLDRAVTSILLGHILNNEYINESLKKQLKVAAIYGRDNTGQCGSYLCAKVTDP